MNEYKHFWWYGVSVLALLTVLSLIGLYLATPNWQNIRIKTDTEDRVLESYDIGLDNAPTPGIAEISGTLYLTGLTDKIIRVLPDDCLKNLSINGQEVDLSNISDEAKCNVDKGFSLDASRYLLVGENIIAGETENLGGGVKLDIMVAPEATNYKIFFAAVLFSLGLLAVLAAWRLLKEPHALAAFVLAVCLCMVYIGYTRWYDRSHDVHGHIPYIEHVESTGTLPEPLDCWECHQKPIYYLVSGGILKVLNSYTGGHPQAFFLILQIQSLTFFLVFLMFGLKILEGNHNLAYYVFALWPSGILHSVRIGNEIALYACIAVGIFFLNKYWKTPTWKLFFICIGVGLVATFVKITGIVILATLGLIYLWSQRRPLLTSSWKHWLGLCLLGALAGLLALPTFLDHGSVSVNHPGESMLVGNTLMNFTYMDVETFLKRPDISTFEDVSGRQYFWNILLKTSIIGEFGVNEPIHRDVAIALSLLLLILISLTIAGALQISKKNWWTIAPVILASLLLFLALLYFRTTLPYSSNQDFRYIYPTIIGSCTLLALALNQIEKHWGWTWQQVARTICILWVACSALFILLPVITGKY